MTSKRHDPRNPPNEFRDIVGAKPHEVDSRQLSSLHSPGRRYDDRRDDRRYEERGDDRRYEYRGDDYRR